MFNTSKILFQKIYDPTKRGPDELGRSTPAARYNRLSASTCGLARAAGSAV